MKNIILFIFVFLANLNWISAQRYDFDYYINYEMIFSGDSRELQSLYNSKNSDYRMKFIVNMDNTVQALIIDSNIIHTFSLSNTQFPLNKSDFEYLYSQKIPNSKSKIKFKVTGVKDLDNNEKEYAVSVPLTSCKIKVLPHEMNLLYSGLSKTFDGVPKSIPQELFKDEKLVVLSSKCLFKDGVKLELELKAFQPTNVTLVVLPNQVKFNL